MKNLSPKIFRITFFFLTGLVLATGLFEIFLRTTEFVPELRFLPVAQASLYGPDFNVGYGFRPNASGFWDTENRAYIEINSLGYRGQEAADDGTDIVFAGHSLTEALQVKEDKTFTFLTGQNLNVKTANLGISGAPPAVIVAQLRKYLPILKPKLVVIVVETRFFEQASVLQDNAHVGYKLNANGSSSNLSYGFRQTRGYKIRTSKVGDLLYWALDHSRIANVLNNTLNRGLFKGLHDLRAPSIIKNDAPSIGTQQSFFDLWVQSEPRDHYLALEAFLGDLTALQAKHKTNVIIAVTGPWENANVTTLNAIDQAIGTMAKRYGITIANLTPLIQANYPNEFTSVAYRAFRPPWRGGHLNETGHLLYAKALADIIEREKSHLINSKK